MANEPAPRRTALTVVSAGHHVDELTRIIGFAADWTQAKGEPDRNSRLPRVATESVWEVVEEGSSAVPLDDLLRRLHGRVEASREGLRHLVSDGSVVKLSVVQWISPLDEIGPGFSLAPDLLEFLSDVGAFVDVDQYLDEPG